MSARVSQGMLPASDAFDLWLAALESRHLANLTRPELTRALRALSSCYVERRGRLSHGGALDSAGKRAAFALFYAPLHFLTTRAIVEALELDRVAVRQIADAGCGTGAAGAAWAVAVDGRPSVRGVDLNAWAVQEANWTYSRFKIKGCAVRGDVVSARLRPDSATALLLAYTVNELPETKRALVLAIVDAAIGHGAPVLIIEPIARRIAPWWTGWARTLTAAGAREDEWRLPGAPPGLLVDLARGAGLRSHELTARTISFGPHRLTSRSNL
jgi:Methyltransferase small domain